MPSADAEALLQGAEDVLSDDDEDLEPGDDLQVIHLALQPSGSFVST